jgi:hypothetical protein
MENGEVEAFMSEHESNMSIYRLASRFDIIRPELLMKRTRFVHCSASDQY